MKFLRSGHTFIAFIMFFLALPCMAIEAAAPLANKPSAEQKATKQSNKPLKTKAVAETKPVTISKTLKKSQFKTIEWTDLMPKEDLDALMNPPDYIAKIEEGSFEDQISKQVEGAISAAGQDSYQRALVSTRVIADMNNKAIRIPGFVVPLEFDDKQVITQFFLVPFFGACIHVPPPPPNQIIFVNYPKGIKLKALYDPFWVYGVLKTSFMDNEVATAAYAMDVHYFEPYTE